MKNNFIISQNIFLNAARCAKYAHLNYYNPDLKMESPFKESIIRKSNEVEVIARNLFPEGFDIGSQPYNNISDFIACTKNEINNGKKILYQACFQSNEGRAKIDILEINSNVFKIHEIKSSTKVDDEHILAIAYQMRILKSCYPDKRVEAYIVYLNKDYEFYDELNLDELFIQEDITHRVILARPLVERYINLANKVLGLKSTPSSSIGTKCNNPYECEFKKHCWKHVPEDSVFDISRLWETKKFMLYDQGIVKLEDVPRTIKLNEKQWMQIDCTVQNRQIIDPTAIEEFVGSVIYPISAMDFETFQPVIPIYYGTKPYSHIPIQFSVHNLSSRSGNALHWEFLYDGYGDPRIPFIENLIKSLGDRGTILVYNKKFEESRLKEIGNSFPEYKEAIDNIITRIVDLMVPFESRFLYHPAQKGSVSLKKILPAWVPELSYKDLEIFSGATVGDQFEKMTFLKIAKGDKARIRRALLEYCKMDTYALIRLFDVLQEIADGDLGRMAA